MDCEDKRNIRPLVDANRHAFATQELAFYNATRLLSQPNPCALEGPKPCFKRRKRALWKAQSYALRTWKGRCGRPKGLETKRKSG